MRNKTSICVFVLALCFIFLHFTIPAYASDNNEEILVVNAAWLDGEMLRINVTDANGVSSALALRLEDYVSDAENSEFISIQAVDLAGNKSGVIQIKNPYYNPSAVTITTPDTNEVSPTPTAAPQETQSAIPDGSKPADGLRPFTPDGTGTVVDNVTDGDGKEFFTIDTEDGSVFYLIVDRQKNADNVYLLNSVTLEDLIALADKSGQAINTGNNGSTSAIPTTNPPGTTENNTQPPTSTAAPEPEVKTPVSGINSSTIIFVVIAILVVGGAGYYFKIVKGRKNAPDADDDDDYDFEDVADESDDSGDDYGDYNPEDEGESE